MNLNPDFHLKDPADPLFQPTPPNRRAPSPTDRYPFLSSNLQATQTHKPRMIAQKLVHCHLVAERVLWHCPEQKRTIKKGRKKWGSWNHPTFFRKVQDSSIGPKRSRPGHPGNLGAHPIQLDWTLSRLNPAAHCIGVVIGNKGPVDQPPGILFRKTRFDFQRPLFVEDPQNHWRLRFRIPHSQALRTPQGLNIEGPWLTKVPWGFVVVPRLSPGRTVVK